MRSGHNMIDIDGLTKRYGDKTAVDGLSFVVEPGVVTGFLGPNGAGKSTTMRMSAGLGRPPTARGGVPAGGPGGSSLGLGDPLGVAAALLGQPQPVVLDEPVNGLDPDGVRWIRLLLKSLAAEGRTVLVSSHLMSEMAQTATQLVVLGRGKLITEASVEDFIGHATSTADVLVRT